MTHPENELRTAVQCRARPRAIIGAREAACGQPCGPRGRAACGQPCTVRAQGHSSSALPGSRSLQFPLPVCLPTCPSTQGHTALCPQALQPALPFTSLLRA